MIPTRPPPRSRLTLKIVAVALVIVVSAAGITWYESTRGPSQVQPPRQSSTTGGCARIDMANGSVLDLNFTNTTSCFGGIPHWGVNISFGWVSTDHPADVTLRWACVQGPQCLLASGEVYNTTGNYGSFAYNTSSLGSRWAGYNSLLYTFAASSPGNPTANLNPGETVVLRGTVG